MYVLARKKFQWIILQPNAFLLFRRIRQPTLSRKQINLFSVEGSLFWEARDDEGVRALASHQCGPG